MQRIGSFTAGAIVEAQREAGEEWEPATIKSVDSNTGMLSLSFEGGFVAHQPMSSVRFPEASEVEQAAEDAAYREAVGPTLPSLPTVEALEADPEAKYVYIAATKEAGNALFKQGKFAWAIRTYCDGVDAFVNRCYPSRERMLWDYAARVPCAQCYSNAALCALKSVDCGHAASLCERAMACRPEDGDLVKVLLRHGQALLGIGRAEEAKELLYTAAEKEPNNRPVREELAKARKAAAAAAKEADKRLFQSVNLNKSGLTSRQPAAFPP